MLERFESEGVPSRVVPVYAFVYFAEDLGRLDDIEALKQRRCVTALVEYVISKCVLEC